MATMSSKTDLVKTINTAIILLAYATGLVCGLGLLFTTVGFTSSLLARFEWTLEWYETLLKYLLLATGIPSLIIFSCGGLAFRDHDENPQDVRNDVLPGIHTSGDGDQLAIIQQHNKDPVALLTMAPVLHSMALQKGLKSQYGSPRKLVQDFTLNRAMKQMRFLEPSGLLGTMALKTIVPGNGLSNQHFDSDNEGLLEDPEKLKKDQFTTKPQQHKEPIKPSLIVQDPVLLQRKPGSPHAHSTKFPQDPIASRPSCKIDAAESTMSKTTVPYAMVIEEGYGEQQVDTTTFPDAGHINGKIERIRLQDFFALKAGFKAPTPDESEFLTEVRTYTQHKASMMREGSGTRTPESAYSSADEMSYFQAAFRTSRLSKAGETGSKSGGSASESECSTPESEFQAGLRTIMGPKSGMRRIGSGTSTPGSVSSSEESDFQAELRKTMWSKNGSRTGSRRSSRPSTPGSEC